MIFRLPPAELGVHPAEGPTFEGGTRHQITLMCDDIVKTSAELKAKGVVVEGEPQDEGWGITLMLVVARRLQGDAVSAEASGRDRAGP